MNCEKEKVDGIIALMYKAGYSCKAIAQRTGLTESAVKHRIARMRAVGIPVKRWWQ